VALRRMWQFLFGYERRRWLWRTATGETDIQWARVVMIQAMRTLIDQLRLSEMRALEVSGTNWRSAGFKSYTEVHFPEYDICAGPLGAEFDIVIADQVFEHLLWPYRAGKNVHAMLAPGGYFLLSTPFLVRVHNAPTDCSRWTEVGMKHFLAECGFPLESIRTGSWGNRSCVVANFEEFVTYRSRFHTLRNEPNFPVVVWAIARK